MGYDGIVLIHCNRCGSEIERGPYMGFMTATCAECVLLDKNEEAWSKLQAQKAAQAKAEQHAIETNIVDEEIEMLGTMKLKKTKTEKKKKDASK